MDEAAAILALAIINSSPVLQGELRAESQKSPQEGAAYLSKYFVAAFQAMNRAKKSNTL